MLCRKALSRLSKSLLISRTQQKNSCLRDNFKREWSIQLFRNCSLGEGISIHQLKSRGLVELQGKDTVDFLHGLVTSDVSLLSGDVTSQFSMMLNVQGRVLYDLLLYRHDGGCDNETCLLLECDRMVTEDFTKIIQKYKIRKKVKIRNVTDEWKLYAAVKHKPDSSLNWSEAVPDPRLQSFGWRILHHKDKQDLKLEGVREESETEYHENRYRLGIPEGVLDLPPGNCLPLESNLIFHNGVSFLKGCYVGQELTARTHHTGVTRKRLMPLQFDRNVDDLVDPGTNITREDGKNVGKFRNSVGKYGLGLMRLADLKGNLTVASKTGDSVPLVTNIPPWWPELPKY